MDPSNFIYGLSKTKRQKAIYDLMIAYDHFPSAETHFKEPAGLKKHV